MDISFQETGVVKQKEDIIIRRGIVHILDATRGGKDYFVDNECGFFGVLL